uniref:BTB domain-containing protein n=1 Tax=Eutreptiella gymnastica TaxID=73025 RepID=A0A7S4GC72_9EUGL
MQVPRPLHLLTSIVEALQAAVARRRERLALQQQQFGMVRAEVEALNRWQEEVECLDVGGQRFHARSAVLSGHADHYLSALVSGNFAAAREADDSLFIDRDPQHFALILQHLREGTTSVPHGAAARGQLRREAQYYGLSESMGLSGTRTCLFAVGESAAIYDSNTRQWVEIEKPQPCRRLGDFDDFRPWGGRLVRILFNRASIVSRIPSEFFVGVFNAMSWRWDVLDVIPSPDPQHLASVGSRLFCQVSPSFLEYQGNGHWERLPGMIVDREEGFSGLCALGDSLVVVGGYHPSPQITLASVEQFSLSERKWVQLPDMLCARIDPCVTVWQGKLIVAGGWGFSYEDMSSMESFDPISGVWQPMPSFPHADCLLQLVVCEDTLFAFARRPDRGPVVHKYSLETQSWQPFPVPVRSWSSAAVVTLPNEAVSAHKI